MATTLPPADTLRQLLAYDPDTGVLTWKPRPLDMFGGDLRICGTWNTRYAGKPALNGIDASHGYRTGCVFGVHYLAHRVAWAICFGSDPIGEIDHINGSRSDNSLPNLRDVDRSSNQRNAAQRKDNKSGTTGVHWHKAAKKWAATLGGSVVGMFNDKDEAIAARTAAQREAGFHQNHGRKNGRPKPPIQVLD